VGYVQESLTELDKLKKSDPRNLDILNMLSEINENLQRYPEAIQLRTQIAKYDPWNATNYLQLGRDYKIIGDTNGMKAMREKINSFALKSQEAAQANLELIQ
jgi:tetratricopeptide (TPR) repeat protein